MENEVNVEYILTKLNHVPHAIRKSDILKFVDEGCVETIFNLLGKDKRFILLKTDDEASYVSYNTIFTKFLFLNQYLSKIKLFYLTKQDLIRYLNLALNVFNINQIPDEIIIFVQKYCLAEYSQANVLIKFPLAVLLCKLSSPNFPNMITKALTKISGDGYLSVGNLNFDMYIRDVLSQKNERFSYIIIHRKGFFGVERQTLNQLGRVLKLTRERVRQIEKGFLKLYSHKYDLLQTVIKDFMMRDFSLLIKRNSQAHNNMIYILNFFDTKNKNFVLDKYLVLGQEDKTIKVIRKSYGKKPILNSLAETNNLFLFQFEIDILLKLEKELLMRKETKVTKTYKALLTIGRPAHYSEIFERYIELYPGDTISEHSLHAILCRNDTDFVWVGIKGTYGIEDWGVHRPTNTLHNEVYEIVNIIYSKTNRPVSLNTIMTELTKSRKFINNNSLLMAASLNPRLSPTGKNYFIPKNNKVRSINQGDLFEENFEDNLNSVLENFNNRS